MNCPKCNVKLKPDFYEGVEIDYKGIAVDKCSSCDGVWLDAGELEAIAQLEQAKLNKWFFIFKK